MARSGPDMNLSFHKSRCDPPACCFYFPNTTLEENLRIEAAVLDPNRMLSSTYVCVLQRDGVRVPTPVGLTPSEVRMSAGSEVRAVIRLQAAFPGFPATVQWMLVCVWGDIREHHWVHLYIFVCLMGCVGVFLFLPLVQSLPSPAGRRPVCAWPPLRDTPVSMLKWSLSLNIDGDCWLSPTHLCALVSLVSAALFPFYYKLGSRTETSAHPLTDSSLKSN